MLGKALTDEIKLFDVESELLDTKLVDEVKKNDELLLFGNVGSTEIIAPKEDC